LDGPAEALWRERKDEMKNLKAVFRLIVAASILSCGPASAQEKKLETMTISYASVSGTRAPLWIAKDLNLYEKYGLDGNLVYISSGITSVNALLGGSVHLIAASGSSAVAAAASGAPVVIIASLGAIGYKLIANPSITSVQALKGKTIGSSRIGAGSDYALRRLLPKLGLQPGKDVQLIPTGLSESDRRIVIMLQGKIDATLATVDNILQLELQGQKVSVLADLLDNGVYTTGSDISTSRQFLKDKRWQLKAFIMALTEGVAAGRKDKELTFRIYRKYMKVNEPKLLESMHKNYLLGTIPMRPFPRAEALQNDIEDLSQTYPVLKGRKIEEFTDLSLIKELESEGFFTKLYGR
jgi:ABC-type nitrate/sulfonate/bicarbonate transport system substrate-binding protein